MPYHHTVLNIALRMVFNHSFVVDNCTSSPCQNNATCTTFPGGYRCACLPGFYGDNCEITKLQEGKTFLQL